MFTNLEAISKDSTRRFSLVVQGGGMRGAYSAGVLACFDQYDLQKNITSITGNSTGAMNAAYFIASQPGAVNVYTSLLSNKEFINLTRPRKKIDIDYMVDVALHQKFPIDVEKLKSSHVALDIILTDAQTGQKVVLDKHQAFSKIYEEFRATSALPVFYDRKIPLLDSYYVDGEVSDLLPVDVALRHNPTDIIVIMTRPLSFYTKHSLIRPTIKRLMKKAAKYQSAAVRDMLPTNEAILKKNVESIRHGLVNGVQLHLIAPVHELKVGLVSIDSGKLEAAAEAGWKAAEDFLNSKYHLISEDGSTPVEFDEEPQKKPDKITYLDPAPKKLPHK